MDELDDKEDEDEVGELFKIGDLDLARLFPLLEWLLLLLLLMLFVCSWYGIFDIELSLILFNRLDDVYEDREDGDDDEEEVDGDKEDIACC